MNIWILNILKCKICRLICITLHLYVCMYVSMCECFYASMSAKTVLTLRGTILRLWGQFCGVWHREVCSGSFGSCVLEGGDSLDQVCSRKVPQMLSWSGIWGVWRPGRHLELFVMFFRFFPSCFCGVTRCFVLLGHVLGPRLSVSQSVSHSTVQDAVTYFTGEQIRPKLRLSLIKMPMVWKSREVAVPNLMHLAHILFWCN